MIEAVQGNQHCAVSIPVSGYFSTLSAGVASLAGSWTGTVNSAGTAG
jgi:hypothetical protein